MIIGLVLVLFLAMFLLPFLPGIKALVKKQDAEPLYIAMDYKRNPRYFGKSFRKILQRGMGELSGEPGIYEVVLSKKETIEICPTANIGAGEMRSHLLFVKGDLITGSDAQFQKEVFVEHHAVIGSHNVLQVLASDGEIDIAEGTIFQRWVDAEGDIRIGENCSLGISGSSASGILLARNCIFRRLYGMPIATGKIGSMVSHQDITPLAPEGYSFISSRETTLPPETKLRDHLVFLRGITIGARSVIDGNIKSYGNLVLEAGVTINGNLFAEGDILIGPNARITGHVFSQKNATISSGSCISSPETIKSIIGKKSIRIEPDVTIYGYVSTEGDGITL